MRKSSHARFHLARTQSATIKILNPDILSETGWLKILFQACAIPDYAIPAIEIGFIFCL